MRQLPPDLGLPVVTPFRRRPPVYVQYVCEWCGLTVWAAGCTMPSVLDRSAPGSWEPEITRLTGVHRFAV
jgi:hypothetical protein